MDSLDYNAVGPVGSPASSEEPSSGVLAYGDVGPADSSKESAPAPKSSASAYAYGDVGPATETPSAKTASKADQSSPSLAGTLESAAENIGTGFVKGGGELLQTISDMSRSLHGPPELAGAPDFNWKPPSTTPLEPLAKEAKNFGTPPTTTAGKVEQGVGEMVPTLAAMLGVPEAEVESLTAKGAPLLSKVPGLSKLVTSIARQSPRAAVLTGIQAANTPNENFSQVAQQGALNLVAAGLPAAVGKNPLTRALTGAASMPAITSAMEVAQGQRPDLASNIVSAIGGGVFGGLSHAEGAPESRAAPAEPSPQGTPPEPSHDAVAQAMRDAGVDEATITEVANSPEYVNSVVQKESGGAATARNPLSSATGAGQFIDSTWLKLMRQYRPDLTEGKTSDQILKMRNDPALSKQMVAAYAQQNGEVLAKAGLPVDDNTLYLAHRFGAGGAEQLLKADPKAPVEDVVSASVYRANPDLHGKTVGDVVSHALPAETGPQEGRVPPPVPQEHMDQVTEPDKQALAAMYEPNDAKASGMIEDAVKQGAHQSTVEAVRDALKNEPEPMDEATVKANAEAARAEGRQPGTPNHVWGPLQRADVGLAGGVNTDLTGGYLDHNIPETVHVSGKTIPVEPYIRLHENVESHLMHELGFGYQTAHAIAQARENAQVAADHSINPDDYQKALTDGIEAARKNAEKGNANPPADLDQKPYVDSGTDHLLENQPSHLRGQRTHVQRLRPGVLPNNVEIVHDYNGLPEEIRRDAEARGITPEQIRGVHLRGKSYLVGSNLGSADEVRQAIFHEHYAHGGLRELYGKQLEPRLKQLLHGIGGRKGVENLAKKQGIDLSAYKGEPDTVLMEELMAHMAHLTGTLRRVVQEWVGMVRNFLRQHGFAELANLNETDLAAELRKARQAATRDVSRETSGESRFSLKNQEDTPNFKTFFHDSKVTDENGKPKVVYHGTAEGFYTFEGKRLGENTQHMTAPLGHFFAENKGSAQQYAELASRGVKPDERVIDAYLSIKKPYTMSVKDLLQVESPTEARAIKATLQRAGYDGIHIPDAKQWVAFDPTQIKSASENTGAFNPTNPDIRYAAKPTGMQKAVVAEERQQRGLEPLESELRRGDAVVFENAKQALRANPTIGLTLAKEVVANHRPLTAEENLILTLDRARILNEQRIAAKEFVTAQDAGDVAAQAIAQAKMKLSDQELQTSDEAERASRYEQGLSLHARQILAREDYTLDSMTNRLRAAKQKPLTPKEHEGIERLHGKLAELNQKIEDREAVKPKATLTKQDMTAQLKRAAKELKDPEVRRNEIRQRQLRKQMVELARKIAQGNFTKNKRAPIIYNEETNKLIAERNRLKANFDRQAARFEYQNKSRADRLWSTFLSFRRNILLSGIHTIGRLFSAATSRLVLSPIEHAAQGAYAKLPVIRDIAAKAHTEGRFDVASQRAAYGQVFSKDTLKEIKTKLLHGHGERDLLTGKYRLSLHPLLDMVSNIHAAEKTPAARYAYARTQAALVNKLTEDALRSGMTPDQVMDHLNDPRTQALIHMKAYEAENRALLKNSNVLVTMFRSALRSGENFGEEGSMGRSAGKAIANMAQFEFPIVSVASNYVGEGLSYAAGAPKAAYVLFRNGLKNLTPDQADYIMRNLGKQTVGAIMAAIGWYGYKQISGFWHKGQKGEGHVFGLPMWALDTPAGTMLLAGATAHRVFEGTPGPYGQPKAGTGTAADAAFAVGKGMLEDVPFFETPERQFRAMESRQSLGRYAKNELIHTVLPPDLARIVSQKERAKEQRTKEY